MKIKVKTLFKPGDEIVVPDKHTSGYYHLESIHSIRVEVSEASTTIKYYTREWNDYYENEVMSKEQFNEMQKANKRDYNSYLSWLNKQDYTK